MKYTFVYLELERDCENPKLGGFSKRTVESPRADFTSSLESATEPVHLRSPGEVAKQHLDVALTRQDEWGLETLGSFLVQECSGRQSREAGLYEPWVPFQVDWTLLGLDGDNCGIDS